MVASNARDISVGDWPNDLNAGGRLYILSGEPGGPLYSSGGGGALPFVLRLKSTDIAEPWRDGSTTRTRTRTSIKSASSVTLLNMPATCTPNTVYGSGWFLAVGVSWGGPAIFREDPQGCVALQGPPNGWSGFNPITKIASGYRGPGAGSDRLWVLTNFTRIYALTWQ